MLIPVDGHMGVHYTILSPVYMLKFSTTKSFLKNLLSHGRRLGQLFFSFSLLRSLEVDQGLGPTSRGEDAKTFSIRKHSHLARPGTVGAQQDTGQMWFCSFPLVWVGVVRIHPSSTYSGNITIWM